MNTSKLIYEQLDNNVFSYGEALSLILENGGKAVSSLPNEDFVFPDKSVIRLTNTSLQLMEYLQE
jgi:hypothetical protein